MQVDLKMTNYDYSMALTVTYIPYIITELPSNLLLKVCHLSLPVSGAAHTSCVRLSVLTFCFPLCSRSGAWLRHVKVGVKKARGKPSTYASTQAL